MSARDDAVRKAALDAQVRTDRSVRRLAPGTIGGRSEQAQPTPTLNRYPPVVTPTEIVSFFLPGLISDFAGKPSGVYIPGSGRRLTQIQNVLRIAGSTDTVVQVLKNGVEGARYTIPNGSVSLRVVTSITMADTVDQFGFAILTAGVGATDLTQTVTLV